MFAATYFEDPEHARIIYLSAGALFVFGVAVAVVTVWWWKASKVDHPVLGPLEVMSTRNWEDSDRLARRQSLESVRATPNDFSVSPPGGVAYVPMPEIGDDELDQFAANDVFDEYTRLTSGAATPTRRPASVAPAAPVLYDQHDEPAHDSDEHEHDSDWHEHEHFDDDHFDDEFGDGWGVQDAEEGLDAGFSIDPLLRRRDQY